MENFIIKKEGKFEYVEEGEGHTIILLHGLFGALSNFKDVINYFSKKHKVVVPLMPILTMPIKRANVKELSKFIAKFINYKGYNNFSLLGNSLGGHVAILYTLKVQDKVHSLILTGSSGLYENAFGGSFPRRNDRNFLKNKVAITFYDPKHATDELVDEVADIVSNRLKALRTISLAKSAIRNNMRNHLHKILVPTLLIWGKNDVITPPNVAVEFNELIPDSELFWIDKCGHAPMMEHPEIFNKILDNWLDKLLSAKTTV